jgi:phage gp29-like protein
VDSPYKRTVAEVKKAKDPQDLHARLVQLASGLDPAQFRQLMAKALFAADVLGYVGAEERSL